MLQDCYEEFHVLADAVENVARLVYPNHTELLKNATKMKERIVKWGEMLEEIAVLDEDVADS